MNVHQIKNKYHALEKQGEAPIPQNGHTKTIRNL